MVNNEEVDLCNVEASRSLNKQKILEDHFLENKIIEDHFVDKSPSLNPATCEVYIVQICGTVSVKFLY